MANPTASYGRRAGWIAPIQLNDFSGGLNTVSAPSELADNETGDCLNVTLDENGALQKRLGLTKLNLSGALPGIASTEHWSPSLQLVILQVDSTLYKTSDFVTFTSFKVFSSSAIAAFCEFQGQVVFVHAADGVFTYDGTTITNRSGTIKGTCIAAWQNKVIVSGNAAAPSLVTCSATGDATGWTVGAAGCAQNQLREKDDTVVTALGVGDGQDISGRPGLLAFKGESSYRINDSATLGYTTIDNAYGCAGPRALASNGGVTAVFNKHGIFTVDPSGTSEMTNVGLRLANLWTSTQINYSLLSGVAAGVYRDRIVFSIPWGQGATENTRTFEYHPTVGWIVPHDFGVAAFTTYAQNDSLLYAVAAASTNAWNVFTGWSDNGDDITMRFRTHEIQPASGYLSRFRRARLFGRGIFDLYALIDQDQGVGVLIPVSLVGDSFVWNDPAAVWDSAAMTWGPTSYETTDDFWLDLHGKSISFMLRESSSNAASGPAPLEDGAPPEVGAVALYQILLEFIQLGYG